MDFWFPKSEKSQNRIEHYCLKMGGYEYFMLISISKLVLVTNAPRNFGPKTVLIKRPCNLRLSVYYFSTGMLLL
jgi:hypothetical protein